MRWLNKGCCKLKPCLRKPEEVQSVSYACVGSVACQVVVFGAKLTCYTHTYSCSMASTTCVWSHSGLSAVIEPNIRGCLGTHSAPKSQLCPRVAEKLQTFYQEPSQLHCVFSSTFRQLCFKITSPKLSKMWLPPLNFTQADQRHVLEGGICPDLLQDLSCARKSAIHSFIPRSYLYAWLPMQHWAITNITHPWHNLKAIPDPLLWHDRTWEVPLRKPGAKIAQIPNVCDAVHALAFTYQWDSAVDRNKALWCPSVSGSSCMLYSVFIQG